MITTGVAMGGRTEVRQGVAAGESVATSRLGELADGARVRVVPAPDATVPSARK